MVFLEDLKDFISTPLKRKGRRAPTKQHGAGKMERMRAWWHRWHWPLLGGLALLIAALWVSQAFAAAPGQIGYPVKRAMESISTFAAIGRDAKEDKQAGNAGRRVEEAVSIVHSIADQTPEQQITSSQTIQNLLEEYVKNYATRTTGLSQSINDDTKFSNKELSDDLQRNARIYTRLIELRLEAPPTAQATILQAINMMQTNIATLQDALRTAPVTPGDSDELSKLVSQGFLTRSELTQMLASATSNRQFLDSLRSLVKAGQLPSSVIYAINYDLIKQYNSKEAPRFVASITFDEMNKVAIFAQTVTPTPEQKQAVQNYLAHYAFGDALPRDEATRAFIMPLVYGLNLTPSLPSALNNLDPNELSPVRKSLYDAWKPLLTTQNTSQPKQLYSQVLQLTGAATTRSTELMEQVQMEILNAARANVSYLALPPGWTAGQVAAVQEDFAQQIKDLKKITSAETKAITALDAVADMSVPLVTPVAEPKVEIIRQTVEKQVVQIQQELVAASSSTLDPSTLMPDIDQKVASVQQTFDAQVSALGKTSGAVAGQVTTLRQDVKDALQSALEAHGKLQDYVTASADAQAGFIQSIAEVTTQQTATAATVEKQIAALDTGTQTALAGSVQDIKKIIATNLTDLQQELASSRAAGASAQTAMQLNFIDHSNQIALLEDKLNLSNTDRTALQAETNQTISQLKTDHASLITTLQKRIEDEGTLRSQLNAEATQTINSIKTEQTQLLAALQDQAGAKQVLKDQLEASVTALQTAQDRAEAKVQSLTSGGETLAQQLAGIKADLDTASQAIKTNVADTSVARAELQQAIDNLKSAQSLTQSQVSDGFEAMAVQLRQAVSQLGASQTQTQLDLAGLRGNVDSVKDSLASILSTQVTAKSHLDAQVQANTELKADLTASITRLQQAQATTQAQVNTLTTDVGSLKTSVATIASAQTAAQQQINQILTDSINWRNLPTTLQFNQDQFRQYQQQLASEFAAKSAALQQQFETYKTQLDSTIQQLRTDTKAELEQLKTDQAALKTQLQAAQQQLQLLQTTTTTTTTPTPTTTTSPTTTTTTPKVPSL